MSLTLGGGEVTLIELTNAFAVFANQGNYVPVTSILCVIDSDDQILYQYDDGCPEGQINERTVQRARRRSRPEPRSPCSSAICWATIGRARGNGRLQPLRTDGIYARQNRHHDIQGKWTIGYTRNCVGVWVGNNVGGPMIDFLRR